MGMSLACSSMPLRELGRPAKIVKARFYDEYHLEKEPICGKNALHRHHGDGNHVLQ